MNKKILSLPIMLIMFLAMAGIGWGACVFDTPGAAGTIDGATQNINITGITLGDLAACNVTASSVLGEDTLTLQVANNDTGAADEANVTISTTGMNDAGDWIFAAVCYNTTVTEMETCTERSGITVDNTVPVITTLSPSDALKQNTKRDTIFSMTCSDATAATLYIEGISYTMTESSDSCSYTINWLQDGIHSWYMKATDGRNTTTSSTYTLEVKEVSGWIPGQSPADLQQEEEGGNNTFMFLLVGAIGWYFLFGPGKSKKKK